MLLSNIKNKDRVIIDEDITYFVSPINLLLPTPKIDYEILDWDKKSFVLEISADVLAKNVFLHLNGSNKLHALERAMDLKDAYKMPIYAFLENGLDIYWSP